MSEAANDVEDPQCIIHAMTFDGDCEFCTAELEFLQKEHQRLVGECEKKQIRFGSMGGGIDPASLLNERLDMLLTVIFQQNEKNRAKFECAWLEKLSGIYDEASAALRQMQLTQGVHNGPNPQGFHLPGHGQL